MYEKRMYEAHHTLWYVRKRRMLVLDAYLFRTVSTGSGPTVVFRLFQKASLEGKTKSLPHASDLQLCVATV